MTSEARYLVPQDKHPPYRVELRRIEEEEWARLNALAYEAFQKELSGIWEEASDDSR